MRKKFVYIGILLLVVAFGLLILASSLLSSTVGGLLTEKNITVSSMSFSYAQVPFANQSAIVAMVSDTAVNFYLFNSTGFDRWTSDVYAANSQSGYELAVSMEGSGLIYGYSNAKSATVPYTPALDNESPFYQASNSLIDNVTGTYYAVVDNTNGSVSSAGAVRATILYQAASSPNSSSTAAAYGILSAGAGFFVLLIAGIILIVYGMVKKQPQTPGMEPHQQPKQKGDMTEEQVDQLYKNIKKKSQRRSKKENNQ